MNTHERAAVETARDIAERLLMEAENHDAHTRLVPVGDLVRIAQELNFALGAPE